ncbi:dihydroorotase [Syntrophotalea acetylenica]|jgi:dihydroorotase|uniref:Dihydroorotase n=1 Tax=Syntrophotalea acetylenica TaxID=29542 RepID=A0A1L3GIW3_SYNAC|nr:dihydroorotase [Syntrophotalea acetylenica]APG25854.1 dihydroorotase [Syntrophotalea acetylenica]APG43925.1 dihydroorotase [Syntrophotalea acetylenica]MDY0262969.1 dihydroorotase [Syntrophotalea acetylenica]
MNTIIKNGRVLDPAHGIDMSCDLLIKDGSIADMSPNIEVEDTECIDASGCLVTPGLIDIHVHLRDPGFEYKEDIESGTRAAAAGGFTAVACMPNTAPVNDSKATTRYILEKAAQVAHTRVYPVGAITKGLKGESLAELGDLKNAGCVAASDDGHPVTNGEIMRRALEYARSFDLPLISHSEDLTLVGDGVMNDGFVATELGLRGIPWVAEVAAIARDVMLAEYTGARLHIAHVSTRGAVDIIRAAQKRGVRVTAETAPHYFTLTEDAVRGYNTNAKMNPPLRSGDDLEAIRAGLADGTLSVIATDHAPHHLDEKNVEFNLALNGIIGLETSLPLTLRLVEEGVLSLSEAIFCLTAGPARALNLPGGTLEVGRPADVTIIDPEVKWTMDPAAGRSRSQNTPFGGWKLKGRAICTLVDGRVRFKR